MKITASKALALALAGILACSTGYAEEVDVAAKVDTDEINRNLAREAVEAAAEEAVEAVRSATRLELDIRLIGPTSVKIAGER